MNKLQCSTPYSLVFLFLPFLFPLVLSQQHAANQTRIMITLSQLINGTALGWDVTKQPNPCLWKEVTCNDSLVITRLALSGFDLSNSSFLPVVCQLRSLQALDVSNNRLSSIPDEFMASCGEIDRLKLLNFSRNSLHGSLPTFTGFVGLESLDFSYNLMNEYISSQLDELVNLKSLELSHNLFNWSIPSNFGKSKALERLDLSYNSFHGEIPEDIADYKNLKLIDLNVNKLSGSIPDRIGELANLEVLILSSNNLIGPIPTTLSNISTLSLFAANQNNLAGKIPNGLTRYMKNLDLSYNKLIGPIPSDLLSHPNLQTLDLSYNMLEGSIPDKISSSLIGLRLRSNMLDGVIPSANFATLEELIYLELENNSLSGTIPHQLGDCRTLRLLNLARNKLNGSLPVQMGNLRNLQIMMLQLNNLSGEIPSHIGKLQMLSQLNIGRNSLSGSIPSSISNLQKLTNLDLHHNNLGGSIPGSIMNMSSLRELQLGENQLRGPIPMMPLELMTLNLGFNQFEGSIPDSLAQLTRLEFLDLSTNKFNGKIPEFFTQMTMLIKFNLSNNQLSGIVPNLNSWVSLDITGNPNLTSTIAVNNSSKPTKRGKSLAVLIVIALAAGLLAAGIVSIIVLSLSRRFYFPRVVKSNYLTASEIHKSDISFTKAMETVVDPSNIVLKTKFSIYYKTIMLSGRCYFIKKLNRKDMMVQSDSHEKLDQQLKILGKLSHSNVMTPLAYALTKNGVFLLYKYAPKGSLFDALYGRVEAALDWASRYAIAVGIAQGIACLHGCSSGPIILLDLSSRNIMLKSTKEAQVGDIELCKLIDPSKKTGSLSTFAGSLGYTPPEYAHTMRVTMAGNVYSFGVVLLELLTGKPPECEGTELAKWVLQKWEHEEERDLILDVEISRTSAAVRTQMLAVLEIAVACVSVSPEGRPEMEGVLEMLNQL